MNNNQKQALTEDDVAKLKVVMQAFVSDLNDLNKPKPAKACKWVVTGTDKGLEVGEWQ